MKMFVNILSVLRQKIDSHRYSMMAEFEKREELIKWIQFFRCGVFVETGTYLGLTTEAVCKYFDRCITIELDEKLYEKALQKFKGMPNVESYQGDSGSLLPELIRDINEPIFFWLDAHYSGGVTARGRMDSPIKSELAAIFDHPVKQHVILIDDARIFLGFKGYPTIRDLVKFVRARGKGYQMRIKDDIIRIFKDTI